MAIDFQDIDESLRVVRIAGRLDLLGTDEIAAQFAEFTSHKVVHVIVDLTKVTFLASIGIRALITNAKALQQRGGRLVIFVGENQAVFKTLVTTGVDSLIPMFNDYSAAQKAAVN